MSDEQVSGDNHGVLPEEQDDDSWIEWQTMDSYVEDEDFVLTIASPTSQLFGRRRDGLWHEMVDGVERAKPDYEPTQWTRVPREKWADWAYG